MNAYKAPARPCISHESFLLRVGVKTIVVGIGENYAVEPLQVLRCKYGRAIRRFNRPLICRAQFCECLNAGSDVLMHITLTIVCVNKYSLFLSVCNAGCKENKQHQQSVTGMPTRLARKA